MTYIEEAGASLSLARMALEDTELGGPWDQAKQNVVSRAWNHMYTLIKILDAVNEIADKYTDDRVANGAIVARELKGALNVRPPI
jgi:hypothetical protein